MEYHMRVLWAKLKLNRQCIKQMLHENNNLIHDQSTKILCKCSFLYFYCYFSMNKAFLKCLIRNDSTYDS